MLEQAFQDVYTKFKLHFYQNVFQRFATREATLTTVESFCMEGIMAMGEPTIAEGFHRGQGSLTGGKALEHVLIKMQLEFGIDVLKSFFQHGSCASDALVFLLYG